MVIGFLASCSDVDIPSTPYADKAGNLTYTINDDGRGLTLYWDNPSKEDIQNILIYTNSELLDELTPDATSYVITRAKTNADVVYTVKMKYADGRISEGISVTARIDYESKGIGRNYAMLVPNDYENSSDEMAAIAWFTKNYINKGKGQLITPNTIDKLAIEDFGTCWVMCDRTDITNGYQNLPGGFADAKTLNALKTFGKDGGNLFITNHATQLISYLGRIDEKYAPNIFDSGEGGYNNEDLGVHPIIGNVEGQIYDHTSHPIYEGMTYHPELFAGIYIFVGEGIKGNHNCMWNLNDGTYGLTESPNKVKDFEEKTNSTVLGTWNHVVDYCCAGIVDFEPTTDFAGRILAVGMPTYEWDLGGGTNSYQDQVEMFTKNTINYLK